MTRGDGWRVIGSGGMCGARDQNCLGSVRARLGLGQPRREEEESGGVGWL